jgi:putative FmdB family regulatory protein
MPTYDFQCAQCGASYEIMRPISQAESLPEKDERVCACDAEQKKQVTKPSGFVRGDKWGLGRKGDW